MKKERNGSLKSGEMEIKTPKKVKRGPSSIKKSAQI